MTLNIIGTLIVTFFFGICLLLISIDYDMTRAMGGKLEKPVGVILYVISYLLTIISIWN